MDTAGVYPRRASSFEAIEEARLHGHPVRLSGGHVDDLLYSLGSRYSRFPGGAFAGRRKEFAHALRPRRERLTAVEPRDLARGSGSRCGAHIFGVGQVLNQHRNMSSGLGSAPDLDSIGGAALITPFPSIRGRHGRWLEANALAGGAPFPTPASLRIPAPVRGEQRQERPSLKQATNASLRPKANFAKLIHRQFLASRRGAQFGRKRLAQRFP